MTEGETRAVFLDRDGVLNRSLGFRPPQNEAELVVLPKVPEAVRQLNEAGYLVFVVTNQGGVGLGYLSADDLAAIHRKLEREIATAGGYFTEIKACLHKPQAGCPCRKPKPGMLLELAAKYKVNLSKSYMVGDRKMDITAGRSAGTTTILIARRPKPEIRADYVCPDLATAAELILELA